MVSGRRAVVMDVIGLLAMMVALLDYFRPSLLLLPTFTAGGDTPCHVPTAAWMHDELLPRWRLHGWYPGAYLGHPLLLYYFPLPFLLMSALAPAVGMPVAFKLVTVGGVFLLPLAAYACFRLMGFRFPGPLLAAAAAYVFLFVEDNPIWGGTIASTLAGEFSYTYGTALALVFFGVTYRAHARGHSPWWPAAALALTAFAHGYAVLWAGLAASFFLFGARRPLRTLGWLLAVGGLAFALAAFFLVPLLGDWGWTTPYDDPWITITVANLFPRLLWPLFVLAGLGIAGTILLRQRMGGADQRLLFIGFAAVVAAALAAAGPALGIIDVRFVPFAQLALALLGAAALAVVVQPLAAADLAAAGLVIIAIIHADVGSRVARPWSDWNYSGLEAKELWPGFERLSAVLAGSVSDPRVAVEYGTEHEKAGSIRMYETLPFFSGRSTLEGVYNQASVITHPVYYLASELGASSPNPFKKREYSRFDTESALTHLRLFNVSEVVAISDRLMAALDARPEAEAVARIPPYAVYRLWGGAGSYVEPMASEPVQSSRDHWQDKAYRWFTRKPLSRAHLVFTDDPRFRVVETDEWLAPPEVPLATGVEAHATVENETITISTSRVGHPLLVKVSYHPRWRAEGADGPYLVSPGLMMVIPRQPLVRLRYARTAADTIGIVLGALALAGAVAWRFRPRPAPVSPELPDDFDACALPRPPRRWGAAVPIALIGLLVSARGVAAWRDSPPDPLPLYEKASRAYAESRFAEAGEYARNAMTFARGTPLEAELACLRAESLLRIGDHERAAAAFDAVVLESAGSPYVAQALFGSAQAHAAAGNEDAASRSRERLIAEFPTSPWTRRLATGGDHGSPGNRRKP